MGEWLTLHTIVAFILGVLLSAMVKGLAGRVRSKAGV
jgi:hypothetical protein